MSDPDGSMIAVFARSTGEFFHEMTKAWRSGVNLPKPEDAKAGSSKLEERVAKLERELRMVKKEAMEMEVRQRSLFILVDLVLGNELGLRLPAHDEMLGAAVAASADLAERVRAEGIDPKSVDPQALLSGEGFRKHLRRHLEEALKAAKQ